MERKIVKSSNIKSIGFDNGVLEIEFLNGRIYRYTPKYPEMVDKLEAIYKYAIGPECISVGQYLHANVIKSESWEYERV